MIFPNVRKIDAALPSGRVEGVSATRPTGPPQSKRRPPHRKPPTTTFKRANDRRRLRKRRRRHLLVNDHWQNCSNSRLVFCSFSSTLPFQEKGLAGHVTCSLIGSLAVNLLNKKSIDSLSSDCSFKVQPFAPLMQRCQTCKFDHLHSCEFVPKVKYVT